MWCCIGYLLVYEQGWVFEMRFLLACRENCPQSWILAEHDLDIMVRRPQTYAHLQLSGQGTSAPGYTCAAAKHSNKRSHMLNFGENVSLEGRSDPIGQRSSESILNATFEIFGARYPRTQTPSHPPLTDAHNGNASIALNMTARILE